VSCNSETLRKVFARRSPHLLVIYPRMTSLLIQGCDICHGTLSSLHADKMRRTSRRSLFGRRLRHPLKWECLQECAKLHLFLVVCFDTIHEGLNMTMMTSVNRSACSWIERCEPFYILCIWKVPLSALLYVRNQAFATGKDILTVVIRRIGLSEDTQCTHRST
jgi:hypothetical protein